jgi:hypothetical protein
MPRQSKAKSSAAKTASKDTSATNAERKETDDELREKLRKADLRVFDKALAGALRAPKDTP